MRHWAARLVAFLLALALLLAALPGRAATLDEALQRFTADDFSETEAGIGEVADSGNPLAARVLSALGDGRLLYSAEQKKVFLKDRQDRVLDAATGQPITGDPPADIDTGNVNNRLRRAIAAALGALTLLDPDPGKRYDAAQAVFKSKDENALPALDKAIERETNARARKAMTEARAAIVLGSDAAEADKVAAVAVIRERCCRACRPMRRPRWRAPPRRRSARSSTGSRCGARCRTPGTASRSARCCCSRRSGWPSRSASWA